MRSRRFITDHPLPCGILASFLILCAGCSRTPYDPGLPAYLKAEKELRARVKLEALLRDSLTVLQNTLHIDPQAELRKCSHHPESWIQLIEELRDAK